MRARTKKILTVWLVAALALAVAHHEGWLRPATQKGALFMLKRKINEANRSMPQAAGDGIQMRSMEAGEEGGKLFVRQNLVLTDIPISRIDPQQVRDMIRPSALDAYCKGEMSKPNPYFDMVFHVAVSSSDEQPVTDIALEPADCAAPAN